MTVRIVFMGSPEFSLPTLSALAENYAITGVVTQPDRPAGRGRELTPSPVKILALELGIPILKPQRLKDPQAMQQLQEWSPEVIVVAAFGQILRPAILDLPPYGCINVHGSLLPRWRGASPVQSAIMHGDQETGITIMRMDPGVDTGPILSQRATPIHPNDTGGSLSERLAQLGAELLLDTLPGYLNGLLQPRDQGETGATYAPILKKEEGLIDFSKPADMLERQVRAFNPWPGSFTTWENQILKIHKSHAISEISSRAGEKLVYDGLPAIACSSGLLVLDDIQPSGKRRMPGDVFLRGARGWGK
jgi:methionyl-tRNA formyltransferase